MTTGSEAVAAILIGRNEGARLVTALAAAKRDIDRVIYVDSGSTDDSVAQAEAAGAQVVALDMSVPFTAARARNAGAALCTQGAPPKYLHFIDGDCELRAGWVTAGLAFLEAHPDVAVVAGRVRERFPDATLWNGLCDREWDTPVGETRACGGIFLIRTDAFQAVGGFTAGLIAGEEPELCLRLRAAGWRIWRLEHEMVWHDAAMTRFGQWWTRARRAGHTYAEGAALHGAPPERHNVAERNRALLWGLGLPLVILVGAVLVSPWLLAGALVYPLQILRLARRSGDPVHAGFLTLGKFAEAQGILGYWMDRLRGRHTGLIEYK